MNLLKSEYSLLKKYNVSRETILDLYELENLIISKNKEINLISKRTENDIRMRHIVDSAQAIDFIDINDEKCTDIGSGGGMPGLVLAVMTKEKKNMLFELYEKSYHKSNFLKEVSRKLTLNTKIRQKNIFNEKNLESGTVVARAFKPLPIMLNLLNNNFLRFKNLVLFMGENGKKSLNDAYKYWEFEYKIKKSITNNNSFLVNIKNIKKK